MPDRPDTPRAQSQPPAGTPAPTADLSPGRRCDADPGDEPLGGDPPCWAHLFEDEDAEGTLH